MCRFSHAACPAVNGRWLGTFRAPQVRCQSTQVRSRARQARAGTLVERAPNLKSAQRLQHSEDVVCACEHVEAGLQHKVRSTAHHAADETAREHKAASAGEPHALKQAYAYAASRSDGMLRVACTHKHSQTCARDNARKHTPAPRHALAYTHAHTLTHIHSRARRHTHPLTHAHTGLGCLLDAKPSRRAVEPNDHVLIHHVEAAATCNAQVQLQHVKPAAPPPQPLPVQMWPGRARSSPVQMSQG
jgi:hypothetical protein